METNRWFEISNVDEIPSPALVIYPHRVAENIRRMVEVAGDVCRLRPHIKTHKMGEVLQIQNDFGITRCKCSTIAEAELAGMNGISDILLAMQPVGPNIQRLFDLKKAYPYSVFSTIADTGRIIRLISDQAARNDMEITVFLDINSGMNRTGILPHEKARELYKLISELPHLKAGGLHAYDGHIHHYSPAERKAACNNDFQPVVELKQQLEAMQLPVPVIVTAGSPTFAIHAAHEKNTELSPGTTVLWDYGYSQHYPDLNYLYAALLLTRVVSKPAEDLLCLDLGHKAVASEMPHPRVKLIGIEEDYQIMNHSEEHLVIKTASAAYVEPGTYLYGIPWHVCPTVSKHSRAYTINDGRVTGEWTIDARDWKINI